MVRIINKKANMSIPSFNGGALFIIAGQEKDVAFIDYQTLLSIYGKDVEVLKVSDSEKKQEVVDVKITKPVKFSGMRKRKK